MIIEKIKLSRPTLLYECFLTFCRKQLRRIRMKMIRLSSVRILRRLTVKRQKTKEFLLLFHQLPNREKV